MGLTKQYLRYENCGLFSVVASPKCNIAFVTFKGVRGRFVAVGACENVIIWDLRQGEKGLVFRGENSEARVIAKSPNETHLAVGYQDGSIKIFDLYSGEDDCIVTFRGHKSAISCLAYDQDGLRLISGSKDSDIVLWDVVNESGLFRLKGHKGVVTQCRFLNINIVVTTSADATMKFWDLDIQHCFKTMVGHRCEICDFVILDDGKKIITGAVDSLLRGWELNYGSDENPADVKRQRVDQESEENDDELSCLTCASIGSITRHSRARLNKLAVDQNKKLLVCHGNDKILEFHQFLSEEVLKKKLAKKTKKAKKKALKNPEKKTDLVENIALELSDEVKSLGFIKISNKIKSFDLFMDSSTVAKVAVLLSNNSLETYEIVFANGEIPEEPKSRLTLPGHQSDIRTLCFSSDNTALLSASGDTLKIWNRATQKCIRTIQCDYALSAFFIPGDRHCLVGTKSGKLQLFDIASNAEIPNEGGHDGAVWSICLTPDLRGFASGGADKLVKFWQFELVSGPKHQTGKQLSTIHTRTLQLQEDVLCVRFTKDNRLIAVSLLDSTVKIFFVDTLKFFLSLYGHKFPVLCMDITDDSTLIATGSADRNVKLWGLDFGDCHKSIFAHDDSIMCLQFIPKTHMFFTGGKDGCVKQWDGDNFQRITTLKGHHAEVWAVAISPNGMHLASASHDKSIRIWDKTDDILVLEEENEMEREEEFENSLANKDDTVIAGEINTETGLASKKTADTFKGAEKLMEGLDIYKEENEKMQEYRMNQDVAEKSRLLAPPPPHPLMVAYKTPTADHLIIHILKQIKSSELEESLLVLPFSYVKQLLEVLAVLMEKGWSVELCCRCLFFLLRVHHGQITANEMLLRVIDKLRISAVDRVQRLRDCIGFNLAGLRFLQREIESKQELRLFLDATQRFEEKSKKKKKKERNLQRAILTIG